MRISHAQRPLSTSELRHALSIEPTSEIVDLDSIPDEGDLMAYCAGSVIVDEQSSLVRFVHYTLQEYLESNRVL